MTAPILLDLSHTCHTRARTGIQRVTRSLRNALGARAVTITHDPHRHAWREPERWELANLTAEDAAGKRSAQWPLGVRLRAKVQNWMGRSPPALPDNSGLLVPEIFSPATARALPSLFAVARGPRIALFHDAIALKFPELTPTKTVARFPPYLIELAAFDGVAAVSEDSRAALVDYWQWLQLPRPPPVRAIPLGVELPARPSTLSVTADESVPTILSVGSIEGRKNHVALLEACDRLWARGRRFTLRLIGLAHPQTGAAALARVRALQAAGRDLRYDGPASDADVSAAYGACTFTVYPSLYEGFGLPVIESLAQGKPCVCSARGALGESARGGGCVMLDDAGADALTDAIGRLLDSPAEIAALSAAATRREFRTWKQYADDLLGWMAQLPPLGEP